VPKGGGVHAAEEKKGMWGIWKRQQAFLSDYVVGKGKGPTKKKNRRVEKFARSAPSLLPQSFSTVEKERILGKRRKSRPAIARTAE